MKVIIHKYDQVLCELKKFSINGLKARLNEFGMIDITHSDKHTCYINGFIPTITDESLINDIIQKYDITRSEYDEILDLLAREFYKLGNCRGCYD